MNKLKHIFCNLNYHWCKRFFKHLKNNNKQSGVTIALDIKKIIQMQFTTNDYCRKVFPKKQIYLHHTAGNASAINTAKYWQNNNSKVATAFVIAGNVKSTKEKDGDIIQCFSSKY